MPFRLRITGPAKEDLRGNHAWWSENRSPDEADRWLRGIDRALLALAHDAGRHAFATEPTLRDAGVRQRNFGVGSRPTHRVLYTIQGDEVIVYRVRSAKQVDLGVDQLTGDA